MTAARGRLQRWNASFDTWLTTPEPHAAEGLGVFRILYGVFYLWHLSQSQAVLLSGLPEAHRNRILLLDVLHLSPDLPPIFFATLESALAACLVLLAVGYRTAATTGAVLVLGVALEGLHAILENEHATSFLVFYIPFFMVLAGSPWGRSYSLDAALAEPAEPDGPTERAATRRDARLALPGRALLLVLSCQFLSAALHKLHPDATWLGSPRFVSDLLLEKNVISALLGLPLNPVAPILSEFPQVAAVLRYGVIAFEGLFFLALFGPRVRSFILSQALLFHAVNALWLAVTFTPIAIVYGVFVDWEAIRERLVPRHHGWARRVPPRLLVGGALAVAVLAGTCWNLGEGVRGLVSLGGWLDWRTLWFPLLPLAIFWWTASALRLLRSSS